MKEMTVRHDRVYPSMDNVMTDTVVGPRVMYSGSVLVGESQSVDMHTELPIKNLILNEMATDIKVVEVITEL